MTVSDHINFYVLYTPLKDIESIAFERIDISKQSLEDVYKRQVAIQLEQIFRFRFQKSDRSYFLSIQPNISAACGEVFLSAGKGLHS